MTRMIRWSCVSSCTALLVGLWQLGCTNGQPQLVFGPPTFTNAPPELTILEPAATFSINQGERFDIRWSDRDPDSAAKISFSLVQEGTGFEILLVSNIEENDSLAADSFSVATGLIPFGNYNVKGVITDGFNPPVTVFAMTQGSTATRVIVNIGEPGINPLNTPPRVAMTQPSFNQGVAQDDSLVIAVRPTPNVADATTPYDTDDDATLFILLDLDDNPENDDPRVPDPTQIIVLREVIITQGDVAPQTFTIPIDLATIPPRTDGSPYFPRATIIDPANLPVHDYSSGTIQILRSATGTVDVAQIGRTLSGVRWVGFNPGSRLGTDMCGVGDFDADGVEDFLMVAQFGNPRNFGNIGEAYLVYGLNNTRFGGEINVNSVSSNISGVIFEGAPNRLDPLHVQSFQRPRGITSAAAIPDLSGDGRPELLLGAGLVDGQYQGRDDDPGDDPAEQVVEIEFQQDLVTRIINDNIDPMLDDEFRGAFDTTLSRTQPTTPMASDPILTFSSPNDPMMNPIDAFAIVEFDIQLVLNAMTTTVVDNINDLQATIVLSSVGDSFVLGDTFTVRQYNSPVGLSGNVTYSDYNQGMPGPEEGIDYEDEDLDVRVNFLTLQDAVEINVDVTPVLEAVLNGEGGLLAIIFVPTMANAVDGQMNSSEAPFGLRPRLEISFTEDLQTIPNFGCYPDPYTNNVSDMPDDPQNGLTTDSTFEASGCVYLINSENRDLDPAIMGATRFESTSMALELVGQETVGGGIGPEDFLLLGVDSGRVDGTIRHIAGDPGDGLGRGCRITAGWWDFINAGALGTANPRADFFGEHVASMPDINNDGVPEIIISSPRNERFMVDLDLFGIADSAILSSTAYDGSIAVIVGGDYSRNPLFTDGDMNRTIPGRDVPDAGSCPRPDPESRDGPGRPSDGFEVFAETVDDFLGGAEFAGDVNLDGVPDLVCGAPANDNPLGLVDTGALYVIYGRRPVGNVLLSNLDDPIRRPPTIRVRGETAGDEIGRIQTSGLDINGDRVDDVFFASPTADFGIQPNQCGDLDGNGVVDASDLDVSVFNACRNTVGDEVFLDDGCKPFDFDNDRDIDGDDREVFDCLVGGFANCCPVDNGFVGVIFGNVNLDGDRSISQLATTSLPGIRFFGANPGDRAGNDIVSARDFNRDGFGDLLIAAPGVRFIDNNGRERMGVAYLIFGGTHLDGNLSFSLDRVGTPELPGIIFWSPFEGGRPEEAPIDHVGAIGDINADGFDDIALGVTRADFVDTSLPQDPNAPGFDPNLGRRPDGGDIYIIYGNNTGSNR